jgi:hypothetical protein
MRLILLLESLVLLVRIDLMMRRGSLQSIHTLVRNQAVVCIGPEKRPEVRMICHAIDLMCVFNLRPVFCLQYSAVTTVLLRRYGWSAELVIGAQMLPFKSHAWCEIDDVVVNDKPYMRDIYSVLERC